MNEINSKTNNTQVEYNQIQKNTLAIEKFKSELCFLNEKVLNGEKKVKEAKLLICEYDELKDSILNLNKKMKQNSNVPDTIRSRFDSIVKQAEIVENKLLELGVSSLTDYEKIVKNTRDNKLMAKKYTQIIKNLMIQNGNFTNEELIENTTPIFQVKPINNKSKFELLLEKLDDEFGVTILNINQLKEEIESTERSKKNMLVNESVLNEEYENFRVIEIHLSRYENIKDSLDTLNDEFLDSNGEIKNISQKDYYLSHNNKLNGQLKQHTDVLKANRIIDIEDFNKKDSHNKKQISNINENLKNLNKKLTLLKEIEIESKNITAPKNIGG